MSNLHKRAKSLAGLDLATIDQPGLAGMVRTVLTGKIHGIAFSPYLEGQAIGDHVSAEQIRARLEILRPHINWIRTFSCTDGNEQSPVIATEMGLKSMVGVWIGSDAEKNEIELEAGLQLAKDGHAGVLAIGNETLLRDEITEDELIAYIERAKAAVPDVPVGYVDAYFKFEDHPRVAEACDVILVNCYPFWEGYAAEHAHIYMREMYRRAQRVAKGKRVIIAETGWPTTGSPERDSVPSELNAMKYFIDAARWADEEEVELFYFSSFDEAWKVDKEGDVGAYWGLWDHTGKPKFF